MNNQNFDAQLHAHMEKNNIEPFFDQWFDPLDGFCHTFLLRNRPETFAWYRGWWGNFPDGEVWVFLQYWVDSGGSLFTFISHPEFFLTITQEIIVWFKKNN